MDKLMKITVRISCIERVVVVVVVVVVVCC